MLNLDVIGTQFAGPNEMIESLERFDLKVRRGINQYLTNTFGVQSLYRKLNKFICKLSATKRCENYWNIK